MVADAAEVVVRAFSTLPTHPEYGLLSACVAHSAVMFHACGRRVPYAQVKCTGAAVVGGGAVVPNDYHFLGGLEVAHCPHVTLAAVLRGGAIEM